MANPLNVTTRREALLAGLGGLGVLGRSETDFRIDDPIKEWVKKFHSAPRTYTLVPFWFWNDDLEEKAIVRQIDDFVEHGVHGFVIHPRIGLPHRIDFMSAEYLHYCRVAVDHAAKRGMVVHLYDEGMYPSGSACGQVVRKNPNLASRCLLLRPIPSGKSPESLLEPNETLVAAIGGKAFVDAPSRGQIRGIHFGQDDGEPGAPPAGDILNPETAQTFIELVHERYYQALKPHFGRTVQAIFTDEPSYLGKRARGGARPWTTGLEAYLSRRLGFDIRPKLALMWERGAEAQIFQEQVARATNGRLEETYYRPLSQWCAKHGIALTGHPSGPGDIGVLRHFQLPGQDLVWRYVEPGKATALEGEQSVTGKCSSSAKAHLGTRRNGNECLGAYGWNLTFDEMKWLIRWLLVRGVDLLWPHAFYYSVRGPRRDERPPDVGPNNIWWPEFKPYADQTRSLCWLNAVGKQQVSIAILGQSDSLPWHAAKVCFQSQYDFNYLEERHLLDGSAKASKDGIRIRGFHYRALIVDGAGELSKPARERLAPMINSERVIGYGTNAAEIVRASTEAGLLEAFRKLMIRPNIALGGTALDLRIREVKHGASTIWYLFNEGEDAMEVPVTLPMAKQVSSLDLDSGDLTQLQSGGSWSLRLPRHGNKLLIAFNE